MENNTKHKTRCGLVAIIGRPNTGKSTLLNNLVGEKVAIVSPVPQTTRNQIRAILTETRGQIVFLDTPGAYQPRHKLAELMYQSAREAIRGSDVILHLVDTDKRLGDEDRQIVNELKKTPVPVVLGLNKIDLGGKYIPDYQRLWEEAKGKPVTELTDSLILVPISSIKGTNLNGLLDAIFSFLPESPLLYPEDLLSDFPRKLAYADIIREKLFKFLRQEIPHSIAVLVEEITERTPKLTYIKAKIFVERDSQKGIVIGKQAGLLKKVGQLAREELEDVLGKKIFLELRVEVKKDWKKNPIVLKLLGYMY